ncbi:hypothetical protein MMPV_001154 [Pyropia vietnamensis]
MASQPRTAPRHDVGRSHIVSTTALFTFAAVVLMATFTITPVPADGQVFRRGQHAWSAPKFVPPPERVVEASVIEGRSSVRGADDSEGQTEIPAASPAVVPSEAAASAAAAAASGGADAPETPVAIFVQAAESNIALLPRLLERLHHPGNAYAIHVDAKVPAAVWEPIATAIRANPSYTNVHLLPRVSVTYLGISLVLNTLSAARYFLFDSPVRWTYMINLSASDYPLVSPVTIRSALGRPDVQSSRLSFLHNFLYERHLQNIRRYRLSKLTFDTALGVAPDASAEPHRLARSGIDYPLDAPGVLGLRFSAAEAWMTLHRDFVVEAVTGDLSRQLLGLLAPTLVPEEHFFAMLAANHPDLRHRTAKDALRGIIWTHQGVPSEGARPYYIDTRDPINGEYLLAERVLGMSAMFVRKMRDVDSPLMDRIDAESAGVAGGGRANTSAAVAKAVRLNKRLTCHLQWQAAGQPQGPVASRRPCEHLQ